MDTRNRILSNCSVCQIPVFFNSKKSQKKNRCKICKNILCQGCVQHVESVNGKMETRCNFCYKPEMDNRSTENNCSTSKNTPSEHSSTATNNMEGVDLSKVIDQLVNCPICQDLMRTPIVLCIKGHSMCESCIAGKITQCPLCKAALSKTRNFAVETLLTALNINPKNNYNKTCKYLERGCAKYFEKEHDKAIHENECILRDFKCTLRDSYGNCEYSGKLEEFVDHFERYHEHTVWRKTTEGLVTLDLEVNVHNFTIIDFMNGQHYFLLRHHTNVIAQKAYWAIQLIGTREEAKKYTYKFEVSNGRRRWKITEVCESDVIDYKEIFENENCFVIPFKNLENILGKENQLKIKFHISKQAGTLETTQ